MDKYIYITDVWLMINLGIILINISGIITIHLGKPYQPAKRLEIGGLEHYSYEVISQGYVLSGNLTVCY